MAACKRRLSRREAQMAGARLWTGPNSNTGCRIYNVQYVQKYESERRERKGQERCVLKKSSNSFWCESSRPLPSSEPFFPPCHLWLNCHFSSLFPPPIASSVERRDNKKREKKQQLRRADADGWQKTMLFASCGRGGTRITQSRKRSRASVG